MALIPLDLYILISKQERSDYGKKWSEMNLNYGDIGRKILLKLPGLGLKILAL